MNSISTNYPLDHIGIAVKEIDSGIKLYQNLMGLKFLFRETISSQNVEVAFLELGNTRLELIAPLSNASTLTKFLETRGPGLHHVCYRVNDIEAELQALAAKGVKLIDQKPRPGAHGSMVAFLHPKSFDGVLTELCQY